MRRPADRIIVSSKEKDNPMSNTRSMFPFMYSLCLLSVNGRLESKTIHLQSP